MSDPIRQVEQFVEQRNRRPVWAAGWTVFVAAVAFTAHTILQLPEQNALVAQDRALATRYSQMSAKLVMVHDLLFKVVDASLGAVRYFQLEIERSPAISRIDPKTVDQAKMLIHEARGGIDAMRSVLDSLQLGDSEADAIISKFREDLIAFDKTLARREKVVLAIQSKSPTVASTLLGQVRSDPEGTHARQLNAFALRASAFSQLTQTRGLEHVADLQAREVRRADFQRKLYMVYIAAGYIGAFVVIALRAWRRERAAERRATQRKQPSPVDRPPPNPSIEETATGVPPVAASHVER